MLEQLHQLTEALEDLAGGQRARWLAIAPPTNLMDKGLCEAVAHSHDPETVSLLGRCWKALSPSGNAQTVIAEYCESHHRNITEHDRPRVVARLYRNARAQVATARAAVEAKRCTQDPGAAASLFPWLCESAALFSGNGRPVGPPVSNAWPQSDPRELVRRACDAMAALGTSMGTVRLWTLNRLEDGDSKVTRSVTVPVAAWDSEGFLINLRLSGINQGSGELIEHPEMALRTFGKAMLDTLDDVWRDGAVPVRWELRPRDETFQLLALDGPSFGGALAVGLRIVRDGLPYDSSCVVIAQVRGERLEAVGQEQEKIDAAVKAGLRRFVVGPGTKVRARIADYALEGVEIRELETISDAVEFASGQLRELRRVLEVETRRVLDDAASRIRDRKFETWRDLDSLFVPVRVARGLRPRLSQAEYEELERQRRAGDYGGLDRLARRRLDPREERAQPELKRTTIDWEYVRSTLRRSVVLGDPGFGKTMLLWHEVGRRNQEWLVRIGGNGAGTGQVELAVFVRALELAQWIDRGDGLLEALIAHRSPQWKVSRASVTLVSEKLKDGRGLIAIDALDEAPVALRQKLDAVLAEFAKVHPQARLLLSSRLVGYTAPPIEVAEESQLEVLAFESQQMEQAVTAWFAPDVQAGTETWQHLQSQTEVLNDLHCPLLLRLACSLMAEARKKGAGPPRWERRGELYEGFLIDGVNQWSGTTHWDMDDRALFLDFAGEVALGLWKKDARRTLWEQQEVAREVTAVQRNGGAVRSPPYRMLDLCGAGILSVAGLDHLATPLMFTHRSFGEYLAARTLAEKATREGDPAEFELIDEKSWDPGWEQVILFMAGNLSEQVTALKRLIDNLTDETSDDVVRCRLVLAAKCLAEVPAEALTVLAAKARAIANRTYSWWEEAGTLGGASALSALAVADSKACGDLLGQLRERLCEQLRDPEWIVRCSAARTLGHIGVGTAEILARLLELLRDGTVNINHAAAEALQQIGMGADREKTLASLVELLRDPDSDVRCAAAEALGHMGAAAAQEEVLTLLPDLLHDRNEHVQHYATVALGRMGASAARKEVLAGLTERLCAPFAEQRGRAAEALGRMGAAAASEEVLAGLLESLRDPDWSVQGAAAEALGRIGTVAATEKILARLLELLRNPESGYARSKAAEALGKIGAAAAREEILARLFELLHYRDWDGRYERIVIAEALWRMGTARTRGEILAELLEFLDDPEWVERHSAAEVLKQMGLAARDETLARLLECLRNPNKGVRLDAVEALGRLGAVAAREEILARLLEHLSDPDREARLRAATALGQMGPGSVRAQVLERLARCLRDPEWLVRRAAADALGQMGPETARAEVVDRLMECLHDQSWGVRRSGAEALERRANEGIHVFREGGKKVTIKRLAKSPFSGTTGTP